MSDKPFKDMTNEELRATLSEALEDLELEGISAEIRLTKAYNASFDWGNIAKRLVRLYTAALKAELGDEAAKQFIRGIVAAVSN